MPGHTVQVHPYFSLFPVIDAKKKSVRPVQGWDVPAIAAPDRAAFIALRKILKVIGFVG